GLHRQAATADAAGELLLQQLDGPAALLELPLPHPGDPLPVLVGGGPIGGQGGEDLGDVGQRDVETLGHDDQGDPAQHVPGEDPLVGAAAFAEDQALAFVEVQGGGGHTSPPDHLTDGEMVVRTGAHGISPRSQAVPRDVAARPRIRMTATIDSTRHSSPTPSCVSCHDQVNASSSRGSAPPVRRPALTAAARPASPSFAARSPTREALNAAITRASAAPRRVLRNPAAMPTASDGTSAIAWPSVMPKEAPMPTPIITSGAATAV